MGLISDDHVCSVVNSVQSLFLQLLLHFTGYLAITYEKEHTTGLTK